MLHGQTENRNRENKLSHDVPPNKYWAGPTFPAIVPPPNTRLSTTMTRSNRKVNTDPAALCRAFRGVTVAHLALVTSLALGALAAPQDPPPVATEVEEVVVVGERRQTTAQTFVRALPAPPPGRKAARWAQPLVLRRVGIAHHRAQPFL